MSTSRAADAATVEYFGSAKDAFDESDGRWYASGQDRAHGKVFAVVKRIFDAQMARRAVRLKCARLYANREIVSLTASKYAHHAPKAREDRLAINVCKSCVDTASAKIAKNKPRPLFLTTDGDADLQDRAKKLTQFLDGLFDAAKVYQATQRAFVDSCIVDTGVVKIQDDGENITVNRVFVDEIFIDEVEAVYGHPKQLHHRRMVHFDEMMALYGDDEVIAEAIRVARTHDGSVAENLEVIESWHLPSAKGADDGKYALSIRGKTIIFEPYEKDYFPFVFFYWTEPFMGVFGSSLVEELIGIQIEITRLLQTIQEAQNLACVPRVFFDASTAATIKPIDNEMGGHYSYVGRPPVISTASAMPGEVYQHLENLYRKAYEITGISQLSATGKKPSGLDSGAALREYQDIDTERFVLNGQRFEDRHMQIARIMIDMMRDRGSSMKVKATDGKFTESIDWRDVKLDDDQYVMRVFPVSILPTSPAGRLQTVQELIKSGFISERAQALSLLGFPDIEAFTSSETAAYDNIRKMISNILEKGEYTPPDKFIDIQLARKMAQAAYERGEETGRDRARLDDLATWMDQLDELEDEMSAPPQAAPQQMVPMGTGPAAPMVPQAAPPVMT